MSRTMETTRAEEATISGLSNQRISLYYLELERLLEQVEHSETHYQVLGLERAASYRDVRLAYHRAVTLLHPPKEIKAAMSDDLLARIEQAFERVYRSYSVLANFGKRVEYDNTLLIRTKPPLPVEIPSTLNKRIQLSKHRLFSLSVGPQAVSNRREHENSTLNEAAKDNRRRSERQVLSMLARVSGVDRLGGTWYDSAETVDVSKCGVALRMRKQVQYGRVVHLSLPLPPTLRKHDHSQQEYSVYGLVRRVEPSDDGMRVVGLEFIGSEAPAGYSESPWASFRIGNWRGSERRRETRIDRSEVVGVEYLNDAKEHIRQEVGLTENLSPGGARVYLKSIPPDINLVRVTNLNRSFGSLALVCNRFAGSDGFERLCLRFCDEKWPM